MEILEKNEMSQKIEPWKSYIHSNRHAKHFFKIRLVTRLHHMHT